MKDRKLGAVNRPIRQVEVQGEEAVEKKLEDRSVLVVLRQGSATPHGPEAKQASEIVSNVASWDQSELDTLQLYNAEKVKVASFRDWSFVKFLEAKS